MGGRSLDDEDDEDDSDEDEAGDPRLQRLLHKNCAFYNTKTSTNIFTKKIQVCLIPESFFYIRTVLGNVRPCKALLADSC